MRKPRPDPMTIPMMIPTTPQAMATGLAPLMEAFTIFLSLSGVIRFLAENRVQTMVAIMEVIPDFVTDILNTLMDTIR